MPDLSMLRVWSEIQVNHVRLSLDAPAELRADRAVFARDFASFVEMAILPLVADQSTQLAHALVELRHEIGRAPDKPRHCDQCRAASLVEALASALSAQFRGGAK
jgi:hypothetical protein